MFHDPKLKDSLLSAMSFELNAHACKLMLMVQFYSARGEKTLPVQYLKRLGFTRRQWELATKGSRQYDGRKLVDRTPAADGCEAAGIVSEVIHVCEKTGIPRTYYVIGPVDEAALAAIREQREQADFDVIEDSVPAPVEPDEVLEPSVKEGTSLPSESDFDRGYAAGLFAGYDRGVRDLEAVLEKPSGCNCRIDRLDRDPFYDDWLQGVC